MKGKYKVLGATILLFNDKPDSQGTVITKDCQVSFASKVFVVYNEDYNNPVGTASIKRVEEGLVADMELEVTPSSPSNHLELIRKLTPGICFHSVGYRGKMIGSMEIDAISLSPNGNIDPNVKPLGDRVMSLDKRKLN